jgi:hypothetical protein
MKLFLICLASAFCALTLSSSRVNAEDNSCANPQAPRIGIITLSSNGASNSANVLTAKSAEFENRLANQLIAQLNGICVVRDIKLFDNPANYPALKGSVLVHIAAEASLHYPKIAAIAIHLEAVQGPYMGQAYPLGTFPVLIEDDSDFEIAAKGILQFWNTMGDAISKH